MTVTPGYIRKEAERRMKSAKSFILISIDKDGLHRNVIIESFDIVEPIKNVLSEIYKELDAKTISTPQPSGRKKK
jgi:hypothetical protein